MTNKMQPEVTAPDQLTVSDLTQRIASVRERVADAAREAGRSADEVTIVAVCKTFPREAVDAAYAHGLRVFGENRVQEARQKFDVSLPADASLHLIGPLQTNKVRHACRLFSRIESVDRPSLIEELDREAGKLGRTVSVLLQVNVAREPQKSGCNPEDAPALLSRVLAAPNLRCDGLMTIAPLVDDAEETRPVFRELRLLRDRLCDDNPGLELPVLSMGMTNDFPIGIAEKATHIRIGRALFGSR